MTESDSTGSEEQTRRRGSYWEHVATASSGIVANSLSEVVEENQLNFQDHCAK